MLSAPDVHTTSELRFQSRDAYVLNPLSDPRWEPFVVRHPRASAFHQRGWLEALNRTYGYEPIVVTTSAPGEQLRDSLLLCYVSSWITGSRFVSLPFADHCEPLVSDVLDLPRLLEPLRGEGKHRQCDYVELRPLCVDLADCGLRISDAYCFHELDITPSLERLFRNLHKDSIQRKIRNAEKQGLTYEVGSSEQLIGEFYRLLLITRRRHQLPPQPRTWFTSLMECMDDNVRIRLLRKDNTAIAGIITLQHQSSIIYKYGCSDEKFHRIGGMPLLFWRLIEESKAVGLERIDFGRSDLSNEGLIAFKDKFGTTRRALKYYRDAVSAERRQSTGWGRQIVRRLVPLLPDALLTTTGRMLYRHIG